MATPPSNPKDLIKVKEDPQEVLEDPNQHLLQAMQDQENLTMRRIRTPKIPNLETPPGSLTPHSPPMTREQLLDMAELQRHLLMEAHDRSNQALHESLQSDGRTLLLQMLLLIIIQAGLLLMLPRLLP